MLLSSKSFEQWCIENNRQDVLDRWDYELNNCKPDEITYATNKKYYFKCPRKIHKSEIKKITDFTFGQGGSMKCKTCNSFAQWGIDHIGDNFLEKYWDYDKNTINPWEIAKSMNKPKVWIKCQEKDYHGNYDMSPDNFIHNHRCPYCATIRGKVHSLDSLGKLLEDKELLHLWSDKNKKSPYKYTPWSIQRVWWKCIDGHKDYFRSVNDSNKCNFRCPECQYSKGEERISNYLIDNNFIEINQEDYNILDETFKTKYKYFIPQKEFEGLIGLGNGLLSYDFYLPNYNLLVEFQGLQHEKYCKGFHKSKKDFEKQQEHDKRKHEYTKTHNIILLEIWYYDFDNIEEILNNYLSINLKEASNG